MGYVLRLAVVLLVITCAPAWAQEASSTDSCSGPGSGGADGLISQLESQTTCKAAQQMLAECAWGSSADSAFGAIVAAKCEAEFLPKLGDQARRDYADRMQLCAYRYSRQQGTLYISAAALCQAEVAASYAANPALANTPLSAASFDCAKATTPLEKIICANKEVGMADHVLAEAYRDFANGLKDDPKERARLLKSQRIWLAQVPEECRLYDADPPPADVACTRARLEARFSALVGCMDGEASAECVDSAYVDYVKEIEGERASFDCTAPKTPLQIVICADGELGQGDLAVAQAVELAGTKVDTVELGKSQANWLAYVEQTCPLGAVGGIPPVQARACVDSAFEVRAKQIGECAAKANEAIACLNDFRIMEKQ